MHLPQFDYDGRRVGVALGFKVKSGRIDGSTRAFGAGTQIVDDFTAPGARVSLTLREGCPQHLLDVAELLHPLADLFEAVFYQVLDGATRGRPKELRHVVQREASRLGGADEAQPLEVARRVEPVVGR